MNTTPFLDKQIMDLTQGVDFGGTTSGSRSQAQAKDFIDLIDSSSSDLYPKQQLVDDDGNRIVDDRESHTPTGMKKEDIVPSYDFQPIGSISDSGGAVSKSGTFDLKCSTSAPAMGKYGSLDSLESSKFILQREKDRHTCDATIVSEIDQTLKKHTDNLLNAFEGVNARLAQLESRTHRLENAVDDLKVSVGNNHGSTDGKMRHLENILREVQAGVHILKDKQDIVEGQFQLAKSQTSKVDQKSENHSPRHLDSAHPAASAPQHSQQQFLAPVNLPYSLPTVPPPNAPPQPPSQQGIPLSAQFPSQLPQNLESSIPVREPYLMGHGQTQDAINQQIPSLSQQSHALPRAHSPQQYQPAPPPQYSQPLPHPPQQHPSLSPFNASHLHPPSVHHAEETPYAPPQNYQPNIRHPPSQPPSGSLPSQQFYGTPQNVYETQSGRSSSGYSAPPGAAEQYHRGGASQYGNNPGIKPKQFSSPAMTPNAGGGYPQLPIARVLPQALATAASVGSGTGSGSAGPGNRVPIDDVVDKVTSMGFPIDHVRATVQRLTENGQTIDLNAVLDKLMNEGEVQPPRGWMGR